MTIYFRRDPIGFREVTEADLPAIMALRNDFETWRQLGDPRILKPGLQKRWLEGLNQASDRFYFMAEPVRPEGPAVGLVRMDEYDPLQRSIRVGADVFPAARGKGWGNFIYEAIEAYAFDFLGVHRIWLLVLDSNTVASKLYRKRGFKVEGRQRDAIFRAGAWRDYVMMSMLEDEYRERRR